MEKIEVRIKRLSKYHYRIIDKDGVCFGSVENGVVQYLEFRSIYTAKAYVGKDSRLLLID